MDLALSLLALARPSGDLVAGLVIGAMLGFLAGPFVRHLVTIREREEVSREAGLTDELLERLPDVRSEPDRRPVDDADDVRDPLEPDERVSVRWRTRR